VGETSAVEERSIQSSSWSSASATLSGWSYARGFVEMRRNPSRTIQARATVYRTLDVLIVARLG